MGGFLSMRLFSRRNLLKTSSDGGGLIWEKYTVWLNNIAWEAKEKAEAKEKRVGGRRRL